MFEQIDNDKKLLIIALIVCFISLLATTYMAYSYKQTVNVLYMEANYSIYNATLTGYNTATSLDAQACNQQLDMAMNESNQTINYLTNFSSETGSALANIVCNNSNGTLMELTPNYAINCYTLHQNGTSNIYNEMVNSSNEVSEPPLGD